MTRTSRFILALSVIVAITLAAAFMLPRKSNDKQPTASADSLPLDVAARVEGIVTIWATNAEDVNWIPAAFEKAYPGVKVEIYTDINVPSRVIAEDKAGLHNVDLIWISEGLVYPLIDRGLLAGDYWEDIGVRREDVGASGFMAITNSAAYAIAYRTDRVSRDDIPKSWNELSNAKYKGKMAASPFLFARLTSGLAAFEGKDKWLAYSRQIYADSKVLWSNDLLEHAIVSGERPYVVGTMSYLIDRWKARGLPVEVLLPEPVFIVNFGSVLMKTAPHPNAARLLGVWLAGPDGRVEREKSLLAVDLRPSSSHPKANALRESGKQIYLDTRETTEIRNGIVPEMDRVLSGLD